MEKGDGVPPAPFTGVGELLVAPMPFERKTHRPFKCLRRLLLGCSTIQMAISGTPEESGVQGGNSPAPR